MEYFTEKETAFCTTSLITGLGSSLAYFLSRYLCVSEKLYILIAAAILSAVCLVAAEKRFRKLQS